MMIFVGINGHLDDIAIDKVKDFAGKFLKFMKDKYSAIGIEIKEKQRIEGETPHRLERAITEFKKEYKT